LCVATDGVDLLTSTSPTGGPSAWASQQPAVPPHTDGITAVSCVSTTLCVAGGGEGELLTTTDPTAVAPTWTLVPLNQTAPVGYITSISCPSTTSCVATDQKGNVLISGDPSGGPSAWSVTRVDLAAQAIGPSLSGVSCVSELCVAVDNFGGAFASTNPLGGTGAWSDTLIDGPAGCLTSPCVVQQLYAYDHQGAQLIDQPPVGAANVLTNLALSGDVLTWTDNGEQKQTTLP
jgi:hypothetical protein